MKKIILLISSFILATIYGCNGEPKQIVNAKNLLKKNLLDSESVQFSDLKFYDKNEYVCGNFNAKNKMGGYTGSRRFAVSLLDNKLSIEPNEKLPETPVPTINLSLSMDSYAQELLESTKRAVETRRILSAKIHFEKILNNCSDNKNEDDKNSEIVKEQGPLKFEFTTETKNIPTGFSGDRLTAISKAIADRTNSKSDLETTQDYKNRMSVLSFDIGSESYDRLYSLKFNAAPFDATERMSYDADKQKLKITRSGTLIDGFCIDYLINDKREHPVRCFLGSGIYASISSKNKSFGKYIIKDKNSAYNNNFIFVDYLDIPIELASKLKKAGSDYAVSTLAVGTLVKNQINTSYTSTVQAYPSNHKITEYAIKTSAIPFDLKYIVHYNSFSGDVLAIRDLSGK